MGWEEIEWGGWTATGRDRTGRNRFKTQAIEIPNRIDYDSVLDRETESL